MVIFNSVMLFISIEFYNRNMTIMTIHGHFQLGHVVDLKYLFP